jgi:hypothetical protein
MNEYAFTTLELQNMIYAPPVDLTSVHRCRAHRQALILSLEQNDDDALNRRLASMLNTNAEGLISYIAESGMGVVVKDIALSTKSYVNTTTKRLALILASEWMDIVKAEHRQTKACECPKQSVGRALEPRGGRHHFLP